MFQVSDEVVDVLDADGEAHHVFRNAGGFEFLSIQLAVRGARWMGRKRFGVADIDEAGEKSQGVDKFAAGFDAAFDAKTQKAGGFAGKVTFDECLVGA